MDKLNDGVHKCEGCEIYPCSLQDEVSRYDICADCPIPCCRSVIVPLMPCEEIKIRADEHGKILKMKDNGWCHYFDEIKRICTIYEIRPICCRVHSCRFITEGKVPEIFKELLKNRGHRLKDVINGDV